MPEEPPRVTVHVPGGARSARLLRWRQGPDGRWWAEITVHVPAVTVAQVEGEDYDQVPREPAEPTRPFVLAPLRHDRADARALDLHTLDCWAVQGRTTPATSEEAAFFLKHGWATPCTFCTPTP